ncbi:branched-chain amino acid ABC transporter substrate-binding protein [Herbaspirillum sp. SJZ099]|uniref:branched-chain amino acid ABC transporter substrate-binding protein n=1 Tax=Herbaspirillum sp. SJZ099 TaxID=2572916 RepID=UPI0011AD4EC0|nr:branched-chain amino acid ABC transporter substrate-binding protein [Herbaspirillum sp. SJZ099]TWC69425.1 amino acid/amide ABC transporter substrate-binding protein (HAAT family) [Herbaspirillum sp. SJZ099]
MSRVYCFARRIALVVLACLLPLPGLAAPDADDQARVVLVGFSGALSGVSETFGKSMANAADMALGEINRQQIRIGNQRVFFRLLRQDDRNDPETAVAVARQLLQAGVVAVIGTSNSTTAQAVAKIYSDAGVPMLTPAASASSLSEQGNEGFFRMVGRDDLAAANLVDYAARSMGIRRLGVVDNESMFGIGLATSVTEYARQAGITVVGRERISYTSDLRQMIREMKRRGAEALFFGGYSAQAVLLTQLIQQEGGGMRLLLASSGVAGATYLIAARSAANGVVAIESGMPPRDMPGWRRFEEEYHQRFGLNIYGTTPFAYDAVQVLVAAMRQANSTNPRTLIDTLHKIVFKGLTGTVAFEPDGDPRIPVFTVYQGQGQRWVPLKTYEGYPAAAAPIAAEAAETPLAGPDAGKPYNAGAAPDKPVSGARH